jgi:hypothetical protein
VYDGSSGWYYTATLDGSGTQYPWVAKIWKSNDGWNWTLAKTLNAYVYQPPGLILDSGNRLWLDVPCYTGGQCYPGVTPKAGSFEQSVYLVRLQFSSKLSDGSIDFSTWSDHSDRGTSAERYYRGDTIDATRRYIWSAYSRVGWGLYFSSYDTWNNTEATNFLAQPGTNESYLYPRIRRGTAAGEVWLLFDQTYVGQQSYSIHGVQLWRSTDGGVTFPQAQRFLVANCPSPDANNYCDASDLEIDSSDRPHVLFYKKIGGVNHEYYWKGNAGSVFLPGSPVDIGSYDSHAQLLLGTGDEDFVFATNNPPNGNLTVLRSTTGTSWSTETFPIAGIGQTYSPNLLRLESGSWLVGINDFPMLLAEMPTGSSVYSVLDFLIYYT